MADLSDLGAATPGPDWFAEVAERSGLIFFVMRIRPDVAFEYISSALQTRLGVSVDEALADAATILERIDPDSRTRFAESLEMKPGEETTMDLRWRHHDGLLVDSRAWMRASERPDGSVVQEGVVLDITELRAAEGESRRSEKRNRLLAENAYDVIWTMAMDGTVTYVSPAVQRMRGFTPDEAARQTIEEINPPESAARVNAYYAEVFEAIAAGTEPPVFRGEVEYYRKGGSIMTGELQVIPLVDTDGKVVELLGVTRDISERKVLESELTRLAATDQVTGVWNRRHGRELLLQETFQAENHPCALLMVDIDSFKQINDTHGHATGDQVLVEVARRLTSAVRASDMVARWGGEEFVILLRDCSPSDALIIAENIRRTLADKPFADVGRVTVSIGVAALESGEDLPSWLNRADTALYRAKNSGRNTVIGA